MSRELEFRAQNLSLIFLLLLSLFFFFFYLSKEDEKWLVKINLLVSLN